VWKSHWRLERDPFSEHGAAYVSLPSHDDAVARLVYAIESAERRALLAADAGLGKSTVLRRAFDDTRGPRRRLALLTCPREGTFLVAMLAERLAERVGLEPTRLAAWRALERAIRLASIQGIHVVIGIDNCEAADADVRRDFESLANLAAGASAKITVIQAGRPRQLPRAAFDGRWTPGIRLESLTRSQTEAFITTKLRSAGRDEQVFTARAITRLHCLSAGVPRLIEQLATLCLIAAAASGLEIILPELVDSVEQSQNNEAGTSRIDDGTRTGRIRAG
jgi:general secretion pathway protein A